MIRLLIDMNLTPRWVQFFAEAGYGSVHWSGVGAVGAQDADICAYAREHNYVIVTNDLDFPQILAHTAQGADSAIVIN